MTSVVKNTTPVSANPMQAPNGINDTTIYITDAAVNRLRDLINEEKREKPDSNLFLRISILSGGCSGFKYKFDFTSTAQEDDLSFTFKNVTILTDETSFDFLNDVTLDYVEKLLGSSFTLTNPGAETSCGCGNSFSM